MVLLLPITLAVMGIVVLVPIVPQLLAQFAGTPNSQYLVMGGILTLPALCIALFSPLAGWVADKVGRRQLLITSMILYAFVGASPCLLNSLPAIIASRAGVGLCEAIIVTTSTTMIGDYFQDAERERWLAAQTAVASLSSLILIALGGILGGMFGWRGPFGLYLIALPLAVAVWRLTWEPVATRNGESVSNAAAPMPNPEVHRTQRTPGPTPFPLVRVLGICAVTVIASLMFYTLPTQCGLLLARLGVEDAPTLGFLTVLACLGVPIGTILFRKAARLPVVTQLLIELMLMGIGFFFMGRAEHWSGFIVAGFINQVGCGMILPTLLTWATRGLPYAVRGRGTGMWQAAFSFGQFLSGIAVTLIAARAGGLPQGLIVLSAANAILMVLALVWAKQSDATRRGSVSDAE